MLDAHAHICDPLFDADREDVLERARLRGVEAIIAVGEDLSDARKNLQLAEQHSMLKPAAGLYPTQLDPEQAAALVAFIRANRLRLAAIGEVGLDFWAVREASQQVQQREIFEMFIVLARETQLPLNVHSRSAGRHAIRMLLDHDAQKVQLHAFDGKAATALPAVEAGFFFSIPPSVVRSRQKQKLVRQLPLSCLLVESDSPVLGPLPSERNEPANINLALQAIARLKELPEEEVRRAVSENSRRLYGLPPARQHASG